MSLRQRLLKLIDPVLPVGPRSVLFGAHAFWLHPFFVAAAWTKLYGFPTQIPIWVSFFVHDLGYLFLWCRNMDGEDGERHPEVGARIMGWLFGPEWHDFALFHSRYYAKARGKPYSRLCVADKLVPALMPAWLYLPMARATGELDEYLDNACKRAASNEALSPEERARLTSRDALAWFRGLQDYMVRWVAEHRDGREDRWTAVARTDGV